MTSSICRIQDANDLSTYLRSCQPLTDPESGLMGIPLKQRAKYDLSSGALVWRELKGDELLRFTDNFVTILQSVRLHIMDAEKNIEAPITIEQKKALIDSIQESRRQLLMRADKYHTQNNKFWNCWYRKFATQVPWLRNEIDERMNALIEKVSKLPLPKAPPPPPSISARKLIAQPPPDSLIATAAAATKLPPPPCKPHAKQFTMNPELLGQTKLKPIEKRGTETASTAARAEPTGPLSVRDRSRSFA